MGLSALFYPLTLPYRALSALDRKLSSQNRLPRPVISVGNITWGGTGKTPVVIKLVRDLMARGLRPAVLTRGYRRKDRRVACLVVSDGKTVLAGPDASGDEPFLLAQSVPGAVVMVGADRHACGRAALERFSPDLFVLDDGFQHWRLARDVDIVCINAVNPFSNRQLIPVGGLREPLSSLARADAVVVTNANLVEEETLSAIGRKIARYSAVPLLRAALRVLRLKKISDGAVEEVAAYHGLSVVALSAIGENGAFRKTLEQGGISVRTHYAYPDHYWYRAKDLRSIVTLFPGYRVVTTAKDAAKISTILPSLPEKVREQFLVLETEPVITRGEHEWERLLKKISPSS